MRTLLAKIENFFWNIGNIIRWIPVLWNAWASEDKALYRIIQHQLNLAYDFFQNDSIVDNREELREQIELTCRYLDLWLTADEFTSLDEKSRRARAEYFKKLFFESLSKHSEGWWE